MIFRRSLTTLTIACLCASPVFAIQPPTTTTAPTSPASTTKTILADAEKEKDIRQLISMTGGDKIAQQMIDRMIPEMQKVMPDVSTTFWQEFRKKIDMNELNDRLLPVYDKYYTKEDIKGLIQFYQTPLGQKVITTMPGISLESQKIGSAWGQKIAEEIFDEAKKTEAGKTKAETKPAKSPTAVKPVKSAKSASR